MTLDKIRAEAKVMIMDGKSDQEIADSFTPKQSASLIAYWRSQMTEKELEGQALAVLATGKAIDMITNVETATKEELANAFLGINIDIQKKLAKNLDDMEIAMPLNVHARTLKILFDMIFPKAEAGATPTEGDMSSDSVSLFNDGMTD